MKIGMYARFITEMPAFLRHRVTLEAARDTIAARLASREANLLSLLERAVFSRPTSPYHFLFREAGCDDVEIARLVARDGVDTALAKLYEAGVYLTFDEMKGRAPVVRGGRTLETTAESFANPLVRQVYESRSSGSTGKATSVSSGLNHLYDQTAMMLLGHHANGTMEAPTILYRPGRPCATAVNNVLRHALIGNPVRRWFSPVTSDDSRAALRFRMAEMMTPPLVRICGHRFPKMEVVPFANASVVARAAAEYAKSDGRCLVRCSVSAALTVSLAATENGIDLTGVAFNGAGEPPSAAKVRGISASGARYVTSYAMTEAGILGVGCARGADSTDVHLMRDKVAFLQRDIVPAGQAESVGMFFLTTLLGSGPRILINAATDDFGILEERECGCPLGDLGLHQHLRQIKSVGKLTGRGITLVASDIVHIIEDVLPGRFGGSPQDYQLVEEEDDAGATHLHLLVSPAISLSDESEPARVLLDSLSRGTPGASLQSAMLRSAHAVRVRRQQPKASARGKLPAFKTVAARS